MVFVQGIKENFEKFSKDKINENERIEELYENTRRGLDDALVYTFIIILLKLYILSITQKREENLTNYKQMIDPKFIQAQEKIIDLEGNLEQQIMEINQLKNNQLLLSNQAHHYKKSYL